MLIFFIGQEIGLVFEIVNFAKNHIFSCFYALKQQIDTFSNQAKNCTLSDHPMKI